MDIASINWLAVIVCVILGMVSGALWYNPKTFFPIWWKGIGKTEQDVPGGGSMALTWTLTVLAVIFQAVAMALMVPAIGSLMSSGVTPLSGAAVGFMLWLGFVAPTSLVNKLFAGHGLKIWAIEAGNHLINLLIFGLILGAWH